MDLNYGNLMREIVRQTHFKLEKRSNQGLKASVVFKGRVTQENPFNQLNFWKLSKNFVKDFEKYN